MTRYNIFSKALETNLGQQIFSYCRKNSRTGDCFVLIRTKEGDYEFINENNINEINNSVIGVIDQGIFLPYNHEEN